MHPIAEIMPKIDILSELLAKRIFQSCLGLAHPQPTRTLVLQPSSPLGGIFLFLAALRLDADIALDERRLWLPALTATSSSHEFFIREEEFLESDSEAYGGIDFFDAPTLCNQILSAIEDKNIFFCTSGSTGSPKRIIKKGGWLTSEAGILAEIYSAQRCSIIESWVLPFHIFGFLNSVVLPLLLGSKVMWRRTPVDLARGAFVVLVPPLWNSFMHLLKCDRALVREMRGMVSAAQSFGEVRQAELLQLNLPDTFKAFEILGSTETGGLAWQVLSQPKPLLKPLPSVRFTQLPSGETHVQSDWLPPAGEICDDILNYDPVTGLVTHSGRRDLVFKFGGKRHSIENIEVAFSQIDTHARVCCFFEANAFHVKGGVLWGAIVFKNQPVTLLPPSLSDGKSLPSDVRRIPELLALFKSNFSVLPCPILLIETDHFPVDERGKLQRSALKEKLFTSHLKLLTRYLGNRDGSEGREGGV